MIDEEEELAQVREKQKKNAQDYLQRSQRNFLQSRMRQRRFEVGDKVLAQYKIEKHKKKGIGKGYFPYTGEVVEVLRNGKYYKVKWSKSPPPKQKEGEISRKQLRWDQLLAQEDGEDEELVLQFYNQADSYNTSEVSKMKKNLDKVWRQRVNERGELVILCSYRNEFEPVWEKIYNLGRTRQYKDFLEKYWKKREEKMERKQAEETENQMFRVEDYFCVKDGGEKVLVLWKYWLDPTCELRPSVLPPFLTPSIFPYMCTH